MTAIPQIPPTVDRANPFAVHGVRVAEIVAETPGTTTYQLVFEDESVAAAYRFLPGQFNMLYLPGIGETAISISSDPDQPRGLLHTVRAVGSVTNALARKAVGDQILLRGPFGSAWPVEACRGCDLVITSGGLGLAPLRPVIHYVANHRDEFEKVWLLYGARAPKHLLYVNQYEDWRAAGIDVSTIVDLGDAQWRGEVGVVPQLFSRLRLDPANTRVFTCGPEIMMRFVIMECLQRGMQRRDIFLSMERNMNCAVGFCGHCQLGPAFVCKDGPVFSYQQMERYLDVEQF